MVVMLVPVAMVFVACGSVVYAGRLATGSERESLTQFANRFNDQFYYNFKLEIDDRSLMSDGVDIRWNYMLQRDGNVVFFSSADEYGIFEMYIVEESSGSAMFSRWSDNGNQWSEWDIWDSDTDYARADAFRWLEKVLLVIDSLSIGQSEAVEFFNRFAAPVMLRNMRTTESRLVMSVLLDPIAWNYYYYDYEHGHSSYAVMPFCNIGAGEHPKTTRLDIIFTLGNQNITLPDID